MSAIDTYDPDDGTALRELPRFRLEYLFDDERRPTEVTVFPAESGDLATNWITIDESHAVPLEDVR
ncbi:DUF7511 domain-containing protein [Halegenticoccus soli]|uniref:DUF7511 domain-containing protein n=1 Tax=Halegenticoccus soli TaxID=1985678 RepID=UPI000C6E2CF6|nr:hypothetical protein [Halegenticoccus soli]